MSEEKIESKTAWEGQMSAALSGYENPYTETLRDRFAMAALTGIISN